VIGAAQDTWFMLGRQARNLRRQPVWIAIMIVEPLVWITLYGQLFRRIVELPGFGTDSYIQFLTPGIVVMAAFFSASWSGWATLTDLDRGVIDRFLATPVSRASIVVSQVVRSGIIGIAIMPWKLLENADRYIGWLITYSGFLGPIAGIFIADYWLVRRGKLALPELYRKDGVYGKVNYRAIAALLAGVVVALVGLVVPALRPLYDYAWFAGFGVAFLLYWLLMRGTPELDLSGVPPAEA